MLCWIGWSITDYTHIISAFRFFTELFDFNVCQLSVDKYKGCTKLPDGPLSMLVTTSLTTGTGLDWKKHVTGLELVICFFPFMWSFKACSPMLDNFIVFLDFPQNAILLSKQGFNQFFTLLFLASQFGSMSTWLTFLFIETLKQKTEIC